MTKIIKTLALDVPKGCEVISTIDDGEMILFRNKKGLANMKLPYGQWKILLVEDGIIHLLPSSKDVAIRDGWITKD
jgi:hypothetical protein